MDTNSVAIITGLGLQTVGTILQSYATFKKSNVEKYFELLIAEKKDLSKIGENEDLKRLFFCILDKVANEVKQEKINNWKNLTIKLAGSLTVDDFAENLTKTLEDMTAFDLTVLFVIYSTDYKRKHFKNDLNDYFLKKDIRPEFIQQSLKRIARHNLISEEADRMGHEAGRDEYFGQELIYAKNELGKHFISVISDQKDV